MKCLKTNTTNCGILYSTPQQSAFCAIPTPPAFPELLQVPRVDLRARPDRPNVPILTTVGNSGVTADALGWSQDFLPTLRQADYDRVLNVLLEVRNNLFASRGAFDTYVAVLDGAARVGVPLSSAVEPTGRAYIDNAWFAQNRDSTNLLYITVDDCGTFTCPRNRIAIFIHSHSQSHVDFVPSFPRTRAFLPAATSSLHIAHPLTLFPNHHPSLPPPNLQPRSKPK